MKKKKRLTGKALEAKFDAGEPILEHFDTENVVRRIVIDLPSWMLGALDAEASRIGISRQAVIKTWLAERLDDQEETKSTLNSVR